MSKLKTLVIGIDDKYNEIISTTLKIANNLYNQVLYIKKQNYFNHKGSKKSNQEIKFSEEIPTFKNGSDYYDYVISLENYSQLPSQVAQNVAIKVDTDFSSFIALLNKKNNGKYSAKVNIPGYKNKDKEFEADFSSGNFRVYYDLEKKQTILKLTTKSEYNFKDSKLNDIHIENNNGKIVLIINYIVNNIKTIKIKKKYDKYQANITYSKTNVKIADKQKRRSIAKEEENILKNLKIDKNNSHAIYGDLGVKYLITIMDEAGKAELYVAAQSQNINYIYNKTKAKLQGDLDLLDPNPYIVKRNIIINYLKEINIIEKKEMKIQGELPTGKREHSGVNIKEVLEDMKSKYTDIDIYNKVIEQITLLVEAKYKEFLVENDKKVIVFDRKNYTVKEINSNEKLKERIIKNHKYKMNKISKKRHNRIQTELHTIAKAITKKAHKNDVTEIIIGKNTNWKQESSLEKKSNQKFQQLPYNKLIDYISYKSETQKTLYGKCFTIEESYTSKCDHLAKEEMKYKKEEEYLGKRKFRGCFKSSTGKILHADVNGTIGMLRKSARRAYFKYNDCFSSNHIFSIRQKNYSIIF